MKKTLFVMIATVFCTASLLTVPACSTDQEGVTSTYRSQYQTFEASVADATAAAEASLTGLELADVESSSTKVDGQATGKKSDGTKVTVSVASVTDTTSEVTVYVGKLGDPVIGKQILADVAATLAK